jgi:hypothetical protein
MRKRRKRIQAGPGSLDVPVPPKNLIRSRFHDPIPVYSAKQPLEPTPHCLDLRMKLSTRNRCS